MYLQFCPGIMRTTNKVKNRVSPDNKFIREVQWQRLNLTSWSTWESPPNGSFIIHYPYVPFLLLFCSIVKFSPLRADARVSSSSCEMVTRTNRPWALPCSLKVDTFQFQRTTRRGSPCLARFEDGELLRSGIGDADGIIIVDHGSRRRESNLMLGEVSLLNLMLCWLLIVSLQYVIN